MLRTNTCGELRKKDEGKTVTLAGWVHKIRISKVGFVDLRDRYGIIQIFLNPDLAKELKNLRKESVLQIKGKVNVRPKANEKLETGEIEIEAKEIKILNEAEPLPLDLDLESTEDTILKYRYLHLRTAEMQKNLIIRHKIKQAINEFMDKKGFLNIETPFLAKSTPEGARDYLVPSRVQPGKFYALPQSPQIFKQLFMVAGLDKYYQIVRCFRDEDLRADRQPEFTQLDIEMSFVEEEDIYSMMEQLMKHIWKQVLGVELPTPFPRMSHEEAMTKHKSDKPDLRKKKEDWAFLWVTDFPLLEYNEEDKRYYAMHHPFTSPKDSDIEMLEKTPEKAKAKAYDLVLNGTEIGGGSIRIHNSELQKKMFTALGISEKEAEEKFGFMINAFKYGAPPHGGIAFGLDRLAALITGKDSIRDVIAFPKNKDARDLMMESPSEVSKEQLDELGLKTK